MKIQELRELALKHRQKEIDGLPSHYRLKDVAEPGNEEFRKQAKASWKRVPENQQKLVEKTWGNALLEKYTADELKEKKEELMDEAIELRFLAQTNLFFLCHLLESYANTTMFTHEDICNEFFVQKDPTFFTFEQFAKTQDDNRKRRLLLVPRNGFKSSINMADTVQYAICYPEITILIMTGGLQLSKDFIGAIRGHFSLENSQEVDAKGKPIYRPKRMMNEVTGEWTTSMFQVLFPEHCIRPEQGLQAEFKDPACLMPEREPTVRVGSIEQNLTGMHFEVLKLDDVVTLENSQTPTRIASVNAHISVNRAMLNPYGFVDVVGTWYDENDFYGQTLKKETTLAALKGLQKNIKGTIESGKYNSDVQVICYLRAAWFLKESSKHKKEHELGKDDYDYWFPERLTYDWLQNELNDDDVGFAIKYLNNPRKIGRVKFPREVLVRQTIPYTQLPTQGVTVTVVDTAYSTKSWADYTVIMTARIYGGRFFVVNMKRGRWNEYDLPKAIADVAYQWKPVRVSIEESVGVGWVRREIEREMDKLHVRVPISLVSLGKGSKKTAKIEKAKPVVRLLHDQRIYFSAACEGLQLLYDELEQFSGSPEDKHDDIVSAISLLVDQYRSWADMEGATQWTPNSYIADHLTKERHDMIYGLGKYANQMSDYESPQTQYEVEQAMNRFGTVSTDRGFDYDPLQDAGLGMF